MGSSPPNDRCSNDGALSDGAADASYPSMTRRHKHAIVATALALCFCYAAPSAVAENPVGDFFKRLGRTISKPRPAPSRPPTRKSNSTRSQAQPSPGAASPTPGGNQVPQQASPAPANSAPQPTPAPTPSQPPTRVASGVPESNDRGDLPYGVPVANRPGFVTSPYAPTRGLVDVRGFTSGTEVKDPYTGKVFRTP